MEKLQKNHQKKHIVLASFAVGLFITATVMTYLVTPATKAYALSRLAVVQVQDVQSPGGSSGSQGLSEDQSPSSPTSLTDTLPATPSSGSQEPSQAQSDDSTESPMVDGSSSGVDANSVERSQPPSPVINNRVRDITTTPSAASNSQQGTEQSGLKALLGSAPLALVRGTPYIIMLCMLLLAFLYSWQAIKAYSSLSVYRRGVLRIANTKNGIDNYLTAATSYLNIPVAVMRGAIDLLASLNKISDQQANGVRQKIGNLSDSVSALLVSNQVSNAKTAYNEKLVTNMDVDNPLKSRAVYLPISISLFSIVLSNAVFMYGGALNSSPTRIAIELGLYFVSAIFVAAAYRYKDSVKAIEYRTKEQLKNSVELYKVRRSFIPEAAQRLSDISDDLNTESKGIADIQEAKLFFNGLKMLDDICLGIKKIDKFSRFTDDAPLFDVTAYVQRSIHDINTKSNTKKIGFTSHIGNGIVLRIAPEEIRQIVDSLMSNAVRFNKPDGEVQVVLRKRFGKISLIITDTGIGISEGRLPSILTPFVGVDGFMRYDNQGVGLGLYATKIITDKLGGTIEIRSKLDSGTSVTVTLPANKDPYILMLMPVSSPEVPVGL